MVTRVILFKGGTTVWKWGLLGCSNIIWICSLKTWWDISLYLCFCPRNTAVFNLTSASTIDIYHEKWCLSSTITKPLYLPKVLITRDSYELSSSHTIIVVRNMKKILYWSLFYFPGFSYLINKLYISLNKLVRFDLDIV